LFPAINYLHQSSDQVSHPTVRLPLLSSISQQNRSHRQCENNSDINYPFDFPQSLNPISYKPTGVIDGHQTFDHTFLTSVDPRASQYYAHSVGPTSDQQSYNQIQNQTHNHNHHQGLFTVTAAYQQQLYNQHLYAVMGQAAAVNQQFFAGAYHPFFRGYHFGKLEIACLIQ